MLTLVVFGAWAATMVYLWYAHRARQLSLRRLEALVHFASRGAMDIDGLSTARLEQLVEHGLVHDVADLYLLTASRIAELERFAEKSAQGLVDAIAASKAQPLSRLLFGLGIRHVGAEAASLLARQFGSLGVLEDTARRSTDEIEAVHGIGPTIAASVHDYFADPHVAVPEAARVLRPGGRLVFNHSSPFHFVCWDDRRDRVGERLARPYFGMRKWDQESVDFMLPYGEWIRVFRRNGFDVEDLIELRPAPRARTTYGFYVSLAWARLFPAENVWVLRRR